MEKQPYRILLVESDENQILLFSEELKAEGYEIIEARSGNEALGTIRDLEPAGGIDLLVTGLGLNGGMDGLELIGRVVSEDNHLKTILLTSLYPRDNFLSYAPDFIVNKSSDMTQLKGKIRELLPQ